MTEVIYKYKISIGVIQIIKLPKFASVLCFQLQNDVPYIWVKQNRIDEVIEREFVVIGTGWDFDSSTLMYIDTIQSNNGCVWHLFENFKNQLPCQ